MIICHASDWHGNQYRIGTNQIVSIFPDIKENFDIFIMSGDFLPNSLWGANKHTIDLKKDQKYQKEWCHTYADALKKCIKDKPFLFSSGNHDFINPCEIFKEHGINSIDLDNKVVEFNGYTFYGFPYIPFMGNNWNHERNSNDMYNESAFMLDRLKNTNKLDCLDVLVAHCPLYGILDLAYNNFIGNSIMNNVISYRLTKLPKLYLCGHNHEQPHTAWFGPDENGAKMFISNAATTYRIIDLDSLDSSA